MMQRRGGKRCARVVFFMSDVGNPCCRRVDGVVEEREWTKNSHDHLLAAQEGVANELARAESDFGHVCDFCRIREHGVCLSVS